ncbi:CorA family metal ion transporter [Coccidioides immitis RS]|uniref:CorA family metal ion transporter n=2 Tax=Coccidioides immitis TaxID=5501 RepID=J3KI06_COCIM|nr:CorA family metal ion transporter [Coccidioides immitis RS]EAS35545.3 CorA family metal ion transporter [Coccidioides immitis RS]KMP00794.1 magnesium transporter ALR2 [Coccidioides immitis RMSCC 2394]TPX26212.1 CorA metal ion transporter [Coccidioides immitis]
MSNTNIPASPTARGSSPNPGRDVQRAYQGSPHRVSPFPETQIGPQGASNRHGKKRKHRHHKRRRHRRPSFAPATVETPPAGSPSREAEGIPEEGETAAPTDTRRASFYRLGQLGGATLSDTSLDSEALLDHRNQPMMRTRRESRLAQSSRPEYPPLSSLASPDNRSRPSAARLGVKTSDESEPESDEADDRTPLIRPTSLHNTNFVRYGTDARDIPRPSRRSSGRSISHSPRDAYDSKRSYDVNNPPSMPGSPKPGAEIAYDDSLITGEEYSRSKSPGGGGVPAFPRDVVIDMEGPDRADQIGSAPPSPPVSLKRRRTVTLPVEEDVCFPTGALSDLGEEEFTPHPPIEGYTATPRRRRRRVWPDLSVLEEWSREEKEERTEGIRAKKISEPVLIGGRLRTRNAPWRREEEEAPYRFTYFNEEFQSTIHSQTISELVQPGQTFKDLFFPEPPELESGDEEEEDEFRPLTLNGTRTNSLSMPGYNGRSDRDSAVADSREVSPNHAPGSSPTQKEKRYGPRPTFWLDVLCPTDAEMRIIAKAFGIHALTAEDIMMQEAREKVELFRHYYFINYRTFEQDVNSENFLEPVNMYVIVFREGLLSFHFSQTPHPANVRRRIRQLKDYLILNSDWISYAIIDDITDVFGPLIHSIEEEVDDIDDTILRMHSDSKDPNDTAPPESAVSGSDMLRRVGECRKKVMGLYRLLGNKADVIKGFAKRCNEQWEVAPKSEIGLYLGDIQDHILTMTGNLTHYETLLSRAHSNYLAQINIRMNERQEQTADVLGKLTVLGTIVLPMNIICGMWGMNVKVPGQDVENLHWFLSITAGLVIFAFVCFYVAKRVYRIV